MRLSGRADGLQRLLTIHLQRYSLPFCVFFSGSPQLSELKHGEWIAENLSFARLEWHTGRSAEVLGITVGKRAIEMLDSELNGEGAEGT